MGFLELRRQGGVSHEIPACHRRGKVCNRLSLFSPLFCAQAWRCLRLGLAFRVVDIPQSGLLAQIISLR